MIHPQSFRQNSIPQSTNNWDWNPSTDKVFQQLKAWICSWVLHTTLATYYDREKPIASQTDASVYGLSAALLQDSCSITFASKTLTHWDQVWKYQEFIYMLQPWKYHTFIYGRHITIQTDHKPLKMMQHKLIHTTPPCLQRMLLWMQKYNCTIQ